MSEDTNVLQLRPYCAGPDQPHNADARSLPDDNDGDGDDDGDDDGGGGGGDNNNGSGDGDGGGGGEHIAVVWRPEPLWCFADVDAGVDWRAALAAAAETAFRETVSIQQPSDVHFRVHTSSDNTDSTEVPGGCSGCAALRHATADSIGTLFREGPSVSVLPPPPPGSATTRRWQGPRGEVSWGTENLTVTARLSCDLAGDLDWRSPLADAAVQLVCAMLGHVAESDLEFEAQ